VPTTDEGASVAQAREHAADIIRRAPALQTYSTIL
jgi:hypothetical protein